MYVCMYMYMYIILCVFAVQDFGSPRLTSAPQVIVIDIVLRPKRPIFLHDTYTAETAEIISTDTPQSIPCVSTGHGNSQEDYVTAGERMISNVKAVDGNTESEDDITYEIFSGECDLYYKWLITMCL